MTKIIHCADLHLDSPMETHMTEEQASIRNTEIIHTFLRLTEYAAKNDVRAVIIAGDMFDGERIKIRTVDEILDAIRRTPNVDYLYLAGNHEDVHSRESTEKALAEAQRKLITFMEENPDVENDTADADASIPNMEELQISEKNIQEQIDNIDEKLRKLRQERDSIRRLVENIPVWEDRMARLKIEEENAEKKMCSYRTDNVLIEPS